MFYTHVEPGDLDFSGPEVWPKITAERVSDLVIHRRPELAYLEALRRKKRLEAGKGETANVHVAIAYMAYDHEKKKFTPASVARTKFWHFVQEDRADDVRKLLQDIRRALERMMPDKPDPMVGVKIIFTSELNWKAPLTTFQSRWM